MKGNWINVWEKLPNSLELVLIQLKNKTFCNGYAEITKYHVKWYDDKGKNIIPTHWMSID